LTSPPIHNSLSSHYTDGDEDRRREGGMAFPIPPAYRTNEKGEVRG